MRLSTRTLLLANPASGRGRAARIFSSVCEFLRHRGLAVECVKAPGAKEMTARAASAHTDGFECVVVLGGDGAVHFVLRGLFGTGLPLGIIPAGTGNDIATALGYPRDPIAAAASLLRSDARAIDVIEARFANGVTHVFIGAGGTGLDAEANILANTRFRKLPGAMRYVAAALAALRSSDPLTLEVQCDGRQWNGPALLAAVANVPSYGAGMIIAPAAAMSDGLIEVTLAGDLSFWRVLEAFPILLRDGRLEWPEITRLRGRHLTLRANRRAWFHGDGELLGEIPVAIRLLPRALQVIAPGEGP